MTTGKILHCASQRSALCLKRAAMLSLLERGGLSAVCNCGSFDLSQSLCLLNLPEFFAWVFIIQQ